MRAAAPQTAALLSAWVIALVMLWPSTAEAFRCGNQLVSEGDPAFRVERACGPPTAIRRLSPRHHDHHGPRETIWYYDLGPTRLLRILHFRDGRLRRIETESRIGGTTGDCRPVIIRSGMTALELLRRCGKPDQRESRRRLHRSRQRYSDRALVREVVVEEWYYAFGSRYIDRRVRLVNGRVTEVDTVP